MSKDSYNLGHTGFMKNINLVDIFSYQNSSIKKGMQLNMRKNHFIKKSIVIFILFLLANVLGYKVSAEPAASTLYFGITEMRPATNMGYALGNPNSGAEKIWNIMQYSNSNYNDPTETSVYCIKADVGFSDDNRTQVYDISYNMKTDRTAILNQNNVLEGLVNGGQYNNLLALADLLYVPGVSTESEKEQLLEKSGAMDILRAQYLEEVEEYHLTNDDIEAVQQAAIWYFTNYGDENYNKYGKSGWLYYTTNSIDYTSLSSYNPDPSKRDIGRFRQAQAEVLYDYLIDTAKSNASNGINDEKTILTVYVSGQSPQAQPIMEITKLPKEFDLSLRKYITEVNEIEVSNSRVPNIDESTLENGTTATYKHRKDPVEVKTNDSITYNITIYNEGEKAGRATKIVDQLPQGIEFVEVVSGNFEESAYNKSTNTLTLTRKANNNQNLPAYTKGDLKSETIQITCKVTRVGEESDKILTNIAWIAEEVDENGSVITNQEGADRDSEPSTITTQTKDELVTTDNGYIGNGSNNGKDLADTNNYFVGQQDDDDFEKVVIRAVTDVTVNKVWVDNENQDGIRPDEVIVELLKNGLKTGTTVTLNQKNNWTGTFGDLPVKENGVNITYSVEEVVVSEYTVSLTKNAENNFTLTNTHTPAVTSIQVTKAWDDNNNQDGIRPNQIEVILYKNGQTTNQTLTLKAESAWVGTFSNLPVYEEGNKIQYTVREVNTPDGYVAGGEGTETNQYTITNRHTPETTSIEVTKTWNDNNDQDGIRPTTVQVELLKNNEPTGNIITIRKTYDWVGNFNDLPVYEGGKKIQYTVREVNVPDGYIAGGEGTEANQYTITNSHTPEATSIEVTKVWDDNNNQDGVQPEEVVVELLKDKQETGSRKTLNKENQWKETFTGLAKYEDGDEIEYSVKEVEISDKYTASIKETEENKFTITNSHTPETTSIEVTKEWNDNNDQDGIRPTTVQVELLKNNQPTGNILTIKKAYRWEGEFSDLPVYENGEKIQYTVREVEVPNGYTTSGEGTEANQYTITNSHTPEITSIEVTKEWNDNNNQDGIQPEEVVVELLKDRQETGDRKTLNKDNQWKETFTGLAKYEDGNEIEYSVKEVEVPEKYKVSINETEENKFTITNTYTPETTSVTVDKVWEDNDNQDGIRPEEVVVELLKNGAKTGTTVTLNERNDWTDTFENLPLKENGVNISYSVAEITVDGYTVELTKNEENNYTLTNTHTPGVTSLTVNKVWKDNDDQDGIRPEEVKVELLKNGERTRTTVTLSQENNWTDTFENLPLKENGVNISYSVQEITVDGYTVEITKNEENNYTVTNTHVPETTSVEVTKEWNDNNDQDGIQPDEIQVELLKNNEPTGNVITIKEAEGWIGRFENLPVNENGTAIEYSVREINVPTGYEANVSETEDNQFRVTNTHTPGMTSVTVNKVWEDNNDQDGIRPEEVVVELLKNGAKTGTTVTLNERNKWTGTFENLPLKENGVNINYSVEEITVNGYMVEVTQNAENNYTLTNTHQPEMTSIIVNKVWVDENDEDQIRPTEIEVVLLKNGQETDQRITLRANEGWTGRFENLPVNEEGENIEYTIKEVEVEGYTAEITENAEVQEGKGYTITNTHIVERAFDLSLRKYITEVNGTPVDTRTPNIDESTLENGTTATYKHRKDPVEVKTNDIVTYNITIYNEGEKAGRATEVVDQLPQGLEFIEVVGGNFEEREYNIETNTLYLTRKADNEENLPAYEKGNLSSETIEITCRVVETAEESDKVLTNIAWIAEEMDEEGKVITDEVGADRDSEPETITTQTKDQLVTTDDGYTGNENNNEKVLEDSNNYFEGQQDDDDFEKVVIKAVTSVEVTKEWNDNDDQDGIQPDEIQVELLKNNEATGNVITIKEAEGWVGRFENLPVNENGTAIEYSVREINVPTGYEANVNETENNQFTVTNTHIVEKEFDLSLRKFIAAVSKDEIIEDADILKNEDGTGYEREPIVDTSKLNMVDEEGKTITTAIYNHSKEPIKVKKNDIIVYMLRVYNEGEEDGYATEIKDHLPSYLEFVEGEYNEKYGWEVSEDGRTVTTRYLENSLIAKPEVDESGKYVLSYVQVPIMCRVSESANTNENITNIADITEYQDENKEPVIDRDSEEDNVELPNDEELPNYKEEESNEEYVPGQEDDDDFEKVFVEELTGEYQVQLEKVDENGNIITAETGFSWTLPGQGEQTGTTAEGRLNLGTVQITDPNTTDTIQITETSAPAGYTPLVGSLTVEVTKGEDNESYVATGAQITAGGVEGSEVTLNGNVITIRVPNRPQEFDLALRKWVTEAIVIENGQETVTQTGHTAEMDPEPVVKVELYRKNINDVTVKFRYSIRITNEGDIAGYAKEITDYVPAGLRFLAEDNPGWTDEGNNIISTRLLENTLLQPGESAEVEVVLTWINGEDNMGQMTNIAEISEDYNDKGVPDRDSTPDNQRSGEDDIDDAPVLLSIETGQARIYFVLGFTVLGTLAGGLVFIKKFVI